MEKTTTTTTTTTTTAKTAAAWGGGGGGGGEDFMIEILVRLPVVSLLRFKSVCKSWRHLIKTSFFIDLHTTTTFNSSSSSSNSKQLQLGGGVGGGGDSCSFILQAQHYDRSYDVMRSEILMLSSSESGCGSEYGDRYWDIIDGSLHKLYNLELPLSCGISSELTCGEVIAGSCNGLICLVSEEDRSMCLDEKQCMAVSLWLWNPATRQSMILPKSLTTPSFSYFSTYVYRGQVKRVEISRVNFHFVGFGFDVKTKDYKVVHITYFKTTPTFTNVGGVSTDDDSCQVQVYSLSTGSWRLLEGINSLPAGIPKTNDWLHGDHGLYLNGSYFFVASAPKSLSSSSSSNDNFIISFDFTKEIFNTIQFPPDHHHHHHHVVHKQRCYLSPLGDKLALFTMQDYHSDKLALFTMQDYANDDYGYEVCDIWVLNENGAGKESWTKLHSFQIKRREAKEWIIPRGILNNGEFALLETRNTDETKNETKTKMQLYNLVTKEAKTGFPIFKEVRTVLVYKPSLVSITGGREKAPPPPPIE